MRAALALAALLAASNAFADASASATVTNRSATTLTRADGTTQVLSGNTATVRLGDVLSYSFDYRLEVSDGGLLVPNSIRSGFSGPFWGPTNITPFAQGANGGIPVHDREIAFASVYVSAQTRPWENLSGPALVLATHSDELAEHQVLQGHGEVTFSLIAGWGVDEEVFTLPELRRDVVALAAPAVGGVIAAVPEPGTWALMALGLAGLAVRRPAPRRGHR